MRTANVILQSVISAAIGVSVLLPASNAAALQAETRPDSDTQQSERERARAQRRAAMTERLLEQFDLSNPQVELDKLMAGGPPKDGIPALTDPKRTSVDDADYPDDDARVVAVEIDGEAVAYPLGILNWHEIANDTVGGVPIAVIYCPLCDSVSVMDRRIAVEGKKDETRVIEFGVSGLLMNSNVVMYDRGTDALWSQVYMKALTGPNAGQTLRHIPVKMMTFETFTQKHPDGKVLTTETGYNRQYSRNPYKNYFTSDRLFMEMDFSEALPAKTLGIGIRAGDVIAFVTADAAMDESVTVNTPIGDVVIGATDAGVVVKQVPEGVHTVQTFWHSWSAFHPETKIIGADAVDE